MNVCGDSAASQSGAQSYQYLLGLPNEAAGSGKPVKWLTFCRCGNHLVFFFCVFPSLHILVETALPSFLRFDAKLGFRLVLGPGSSPWKQQFFHVSARRTEGLLGERARSCVVGKMGCMGVSVHLRVYWGKAGIFIVIQLMPIMNHMLTHHNHTTCCWCWLWYYYLQSHAIQCNDHSIIISTGQWPKVVWGWLLVLVGIFPLW